MPLAYTFGNHMHWVDMEWLWGYHVLPGSVRDMIHLCREAGVKGCVNFDGVGYEKLASENPEAFAELREAIRRGLIEPVGCSYGQPYGLFHGGESNIRQRVYGVRTCMRLFGVRPRTFWEEEFDFFPQLPQMLAGCGFTGASLYFQWTWHTPEIPREEVPVIQWEGHDGTRLPTATRNRLNLHQWPEDMQILLDELAAESGQAEFGRARVSEPAAFQTSNRELASESPLPASEPSSDAKETPPKPLILQWLELMPSPDWMCRGEVILPKLKELLEDPRFEIERLTLGEYLASNSQNAPVRKYGMDDVWHGMTLGKNGDRMREQSRRGEQRLVQTESIAATLSLFGRPYCQWDVYPTWELEEAWRYLLIAQHHDNDECEGLCGHVGKNHYDISLRFAQQVRLEQARIWHTANLQAVEWMSNLSEGGPFGWRSIPAQTTEGNSKELAQLDLEIQLVKDRFGDFTQGRFSLDLANWQQGGSLSFGMYRHRTDLPQFDLMYSTPREKPKPGLNESVQLQVRSTKHFSILTDQAYSVTEVYPTKSWPKKYPEGDWMTSPQWFENVHRPFTSYRFVDLVQEDGSGLLILHHTSQQWFRDDDGVRCVLTAYDPWDEEKYLPPMGHTTFIQHGPLTNSERWRIAFDAESRHETAAFLPLPGFSPVNVHARNVIATAFYRETEDYSGRGLETYAGRGMGYPFILRLVEFDGIGGDVEVTLPGPIAKAYKTNLMGEIQEELIPKPGDPHALAATPEELKPFGIQPETLTVPMRPYEIATLYLDLVPGRKQTRDLDAKREVWATIHRTP